MGTKITPFNVFKEKFKKRAGDEYEYISGYTGMSRKILIKHKVCGNEFEAIASAFINTGTTCAQCTRANSNQQRIHDHFEISKNNIDKMTDGEYSLVEYQGFNKKDKSVFKHNTCGTVFESRYKFFMRGNRCPKCSWGHERYTPETLAEKYDFKDIEVIDVIYPGPQVTIKCLKCQTIRTISMQTYRDYRFQCCKNKNKEKIKLEIKRRKEEKVRQKQLKLEQQLKERQAKNEAKFEKYHERFKVIHEDDIIIKEKVYTTDEKFWLECTTCHHQWKNSFRYLNRGHGCPVCKSSKGEKAINRYLLNNKYIFEREYKIKNSEIASLRFDFAVTIDEQLYLIEFDGMQHYSADNQFGDNNREEKFNKTQRNDQRKNEYCKNNNIPLLRIPYWEIDNVNSLLDSFLTTEE